LRVLRRILRLNGVVAAPDCDDDSHKTNADIPLSDHVAPNAQTRYVLERRLVLAKSLILAENTATPISQIVYSVGFNDLSYFNRTFRSRYGIRPTDLRRMTAPDEAKKPVRN
jgi:AraC-like DNA-binding protein